MSHPLVGIGLPVFNGGKLIEQALGSLLAQTVTDFEIVIVDNLSTDDTETICRAIAEREPRVKYHRRDEHVGAAENFNTAFRLTRGTLFKWAAHDDTCAPTFLEETIALLNDDEGAVLAYPQAEVVDETAGERRLYTVKLDTDAARAEERFAALLAGHKCYEVFGLIRRSVLEKTRLIGNYVHGDGVLLAELALHGKFLEVEQPLFFPRTHSDQSMRMLTDLRSYASWFDPRSKLKGIVPYWKMYFEYFKAVRRAGLAWNTRKECYKRLYWSARSRREELLAEFRRAVSKNGRGTAP